MITFWSVKALFAVLGPGWARRRSQDLQRATEVTLDGLVTLFTDEPALAVI